MCLCSQDALSFLHSYNILYYAQQFYMHASQIHVYGTPRGVMVPLTVLMEVMKRTVVSWNI